MFHFVAGIAYSTRTVYWFRFVSNSLFRYAVDRGLVAATSPETRVVLQCPCGPVTAYVTCHDNVTADVRFNSVPSYVFALGMCVRYSPSRECSAVSSIH